MTDAQIATLAADIAANTATALGTSGQIKDLPHTPDNAFAVAAWYNLLPASDFWGNYAAVPIGAIKAAIKFKNYTPVDHPPAATGNNTGINAALVYLGQLIFAQNFQINLNTLLAVGTNFDATNANLVSALKDATNSQMPTGSGGADQTGNWSGATGVQTVICKKGTNAEKLFANTSGGNGSTNQVAATFTFEGSVSENDVRACWSI